MQGEGSLLSVAEPGCSLFGWHCFGSYCLGLELGDRDWRVGMSCGDVVHYWNSGWGWWIVEVEGGGGRQGLIGFLRGHSD